MIVSFRKTVRIGRHNADEGRKRIANSTIEFHGEPKMQEAFSFWCGLTRVRLKELVRGHLSPVIRIDELRRQWTGNGPAKRAR